MVNIINTKLLMQLPGEEKVLKSINTIVKATEAVQYPTKFLNALEPSAMPSYKLRLRVGCPVILLQNLDVPKLCNGDYQNRFHRRHHLTGQGKNKMYSFQEFH